MITVTRRKACTRCDRGWFVCPTQPWAVSCPNCAGPHDSVRYFVWLPDGAGREQGFPPTGSQHMGPMPEYVTSTLQALRRPITQPAR